MMGAQRCLLIARRRGSAWFNLGLTNNLGAVHMFCAKVVIISLEALQMPSQSFAQSLIYFLTLKRDAVKKSQCAVLCCNVLPCGTPLHCVDYVGNNSRITVRVKRPTFCNTSVQNLEFQV